MLKPRAAFLSRGGLDVSEPFVAAEWWERIDAHLSRSELLAAVILYRQATGCGIAECKGIIGHRFGKRFPQLSATYRNLNEDEEND